MSIRYIRHIFISCVAVVCLFMSAAYGEYRDVTTRVNVNEQTDLFEKSTDDYSVLQKQIQAQTEAGLESVRSGGGMEYLAKESREEIEKQADELSGIRATDLNRRGIEEVTRQSVIDELYVDYSKPLNKQHLVDAKKIAQGQDELMRNLLAKLEDIGVDCKTTKGLMEQEPAYYLKVEQTKHKDTVYNKTLCEELRNTYQCNDSVSLTCSRKGIKWNAQKEIIIPAVDGGSYFFGAERNQHWIITSHPNRFINSVQNLNELKAEIARRTGLEIEKIDVPPQELVIDNFSAESSRNVELYWDGTGMYLPSNFKFQYRTGDEICAEWAEDWTERCKFQ